MDALVLINQAIVSSQAFFYSIMSTLREIARRDLGRIAGQAFSV